MALAFASASTAVESADGTVSPNYPSSVVATDLVLMFIASKPETTGHSTPANWNLLGSKTGGFGTTGVDTGLTKLTCWYRVATGSLSGSQAITVTNQNVSIAWMERFTSATGLYDIVMESGSDDTGGATWSVTASAGMDIASGDIIATATSNPTDASSGLSWTSETLVASGSTFSNGAVQEWETALQNDLAIRGRIITCTAGSSTAAPVHTATVPSTHTNVAGPELFVRVREGTAATNASAGNALIATASENTVQTIQLSSESVEVAVSVGELGFDTGTIVGAAAGIP